jgi:uroporphyrinogen-III synthase
VSKTWFDAARVVSLETRHEGEMARLIEKLGGVPLRAPSLREVPLTDQSEAFRFAEHLLNGAVDGLVLLTGVGTQALFDAMATQHDRQRLVAHLSQIGLLCRGPKPLHVLKAWGLEPTLVAPEPNTSEDLLREIEQRVQVRGQTLFIQEYGAPNPELVKGLERLGAKVDRVPVYAWQLPENVEPLRAAVRALASQQAEAILFTSAQQAKHLLEVATASDLATALLTALREHVVVASIGPVTSAALAGYGIPIDTEPEHPKMGQLVTHVARNWGTLRAKNAKSA